jgi:hypothetical protein
MWAPFKKLLARSKAFGSLLGDVLFETPPLKGQSSHSVFQWRVKQSLDEKSFFVSLKMIPDGYAGAEGSPTNYINFDLATAQQIKADLDNCIARVRQLAVQGNIASRSSISK